MEIAKKLVAVSLVRLVVSVKGSLSVNELIQVASGFLWDMVIGKQKETVGWWFVCFIFHAQFGRFIHCLDGCLEVWNFPWESP